MIRRYWMLLLAVVLVSIIGIAIAAWSGGSKSEERVTLDQVPAAVKATILLEAQGGTIKEIERETKGDTTIYEAEILIGGKEIEIEVAPDGTLLSKGADDEDEDEDDDENLSLDQVPPAVKATILKAAHGGKIKEIELENEGGKPVYEVEVLIELEIKVAPDGTLLSRKVEGKHGEHAVLGHDDDDDEEDADEHLTLNELPAAVKATILREAAGAPIREIERETEHGRTIYEAEVIIDGKEIEIEVAPDGTLLSKKADDEEEDDDD